MALVRKNLMVDAEAVRALARERGTSESEAVRDAVAFALASHEIVAALKGLHQVGAFTDFQELFGDFEGEPSARVSRVAEQREPAF
jgi:hypothetical protein